MLKNIDPEVKKNAYAVLKTSAMLNEDLYEKLREDESTSKILSELMADELN